MTKPKITPKKAKISKKKIRVTPKKSQKSSKKSVSKKTIKKHPSGVSKKVVKNKKIKKRSVLTALFFNRYSITGYSVMLLLLSLYIFYLNLVITQKMSGRIWSLPSYVFARPLELYQGKSLTVKQLKLELKSLEFEQVNKRLTKSGQYRIVNNNQFEIINRAFTYWDGKQKSRAIRLTISGGQISKLIELATNKSLSLFRMEPVKIAGIYPSTKEERQLIKLNEVPDELVLSLLAVEDRRFYQHWGVDPRSILRAIFANFKAGETVQGGSTLTQQLVKNLFLSSEQTLLRKINEAIMALLLEINYDKSVILETYINEVYLGQNGSHEIHGFELASQYYFADKLKNLSTEKLALLVGLVKGASWYSPRRQPDRAIKRRNQVLKLMYEQGAISQKKLKQLSLLKLSIAKKPRYSANRFPALIDLVKRQLKQDYGDEDLRSSGLSIFTSIDPLIQNQAEASVIRTIKKLEKEKKSVSQLQVSLIVASSQQGEIEAMVSDRNPAYPGFNRSLDAVRQIGSLIKPAIYLTALQQPQKYTLATILDDSPLHVKTNKDEVWSPQNYDKKFTGNILLIDALKNSRNIPTVRLGFEVGLSDITNTLQNLGISRNIPAYPSMTLGAFNLSPLDVANMYQTFAANGFNVPLKVIREVLDTKGKPLKRYPLQSRKAINERAIYLVNYVLNQVTKTGTAKYLKQTLNQDFAGKTGTSDNLRDSWFAGFSDNKLAVVWLGRDDNNSSGLTGSAGALRLWADLFKHMKVQSFSLASPDGVNKRWIDIKTGLLSDKNCQGTVELPFIKGSEPTETAECKPVGIINQIIHLFN